MNYAFKMMAVVLALGVLVLGGCATKNTHYGNDGDYVGDMKNGKRHGYGTNTFVNGDKYIGEFKNNYYDGQGVMYWASGSKYEGQLKSGKQHGQGTFNSWNGDKYVGEWKFDYKDGQGVMYFANGKVQEGIWRRGIFKYAQKLVKNKTYTQPKSQISSAELDVANKRARELERKLAALASKQKQQQQKIDTDTRVPLLEIISIKTKGKRGTITGIARDNIEVAEVTVDGKPVSLTSNGKFKYSIFVPSDGVSLNIQVTDIAGLTSSKTIKLERNETTISTLISFNRLNPLGKRVKTNSNALALIVGVEGYKNTNASALYADSDAKMFRDYASEKIGIPENRIKTLLNDNAGRIDITRAIKTWLLKRTVTDKTDIYVFFAGHGLATDDGKGMYLLPYDGVPDLLEDSAIQRKQLFADIQATKPRSVTVFLDTCYSGGTRNEETLVASLRPIIITAKQQSIPDNFTVLSAAKGNQTSQSLEEAKHGLFSYYMMLGMEGGADINNDNKITARELHEYVVDKVERQSQFRQTPELQGDKDRVLVQFN